MRRYLRKKPDKADLLNVQSFSFNAVSHPQATSWTLVDVPGHDSLRAQFVEKFKDSAR